MDSGKQLKTHISAKGVQIAVVSDGGHDDYISLTDIAKYKNSEYPGYVIQNWMRNRSTIEFLGLWEQINNLDFNYLEFEAIKNDAGSNAHKDIAFEFASWILPEFKLYVITDYRGDD